MRQKRRVSWKKTRFGTYKEDFPCRHRTISAGNYSLLFRLSFSTAFVVTTLAGWAYIRTYAAQRSTPCYYGTRGGGDVIGSLSYPPLPSFLQTFTRGRRVSTDVQQEKVVNKEIPLKCTAAFSWRQKTPFSFTFAHRKKSCIVFFSPGGVGKSRFC